MLPTYNAPTRSGSTPASARAAFNGRGGAMPATELGFLADRRLAYADDEDVPHSPNLDLAAADFGARMIANASAERHASRTNDSARMIAARGLEETTLGRDTRVLLIGFGNMGQALVRGWLARGRDAATIRVVDTSSGAREAATALGIAARERVGADRSGGARDVAPDVVVVAVKPNQLAAALAELVPLARGSVFLSIAAGKTLAQLETTLSAGAAVVRAMPNTPPRSAKGSPRWSRTPPSHRSSERYATSCSPRSARRRGSTTRGTWMR